MKSRASQNQAFTLMELLLVIAFCVVLIAFLYPGLDNRPTRAPRITCCNNLKQIGLAFKTWALDNDDRFPMSVPATNGGPAVNISTNANFMSTDPPAVYLFEIFGVMSNELSTPKLVVCPSDERQAMTNFNMEHPNYDGSAAPYDFCNVNLSYFIGLQGANSIETNPQRFLAGDRNIINTTVNGSATMPSLTGHGAGNNPYGDSSPANVVGGSYWAMGTNFAANAATPAWTPDVMHKGQGNVGLWDGSVQQLSSSRLRTQLESTGDTTAVPGPNTLIFP
jgi:prepilin-type processing-associated H-X9-DG protein